MWNHFLITNIKSSERIKYFWLLFKCPKSLLRETFSLTSQFLSTQSINFHDDYLKIYQDFKDYLLVRTVSFIAENDVGTDFQSDANSPEYQSEITSYSLFCGNRMWYGKYLHERCTCSILLQHVSHQVRAPTLLP